MAAIGIVLRQHLPEFEIVKEYYTAAPREPTLRGDLAVDRVDTFDSTFKNLAEQILAFRRSHVVVVAHGNHTQGLIMNVARHVQGRRRPVHPQVRAAGRRARCREGQSRPRSIRMCSRTSPRSASSRTRPRFRSPAPAARSATRRSVAVAVHVRGCDIGYDVNHLIAIRRLFNSAVVSAPKCPMWFSGVRPEPKTAEKYAKANPRPRGRRVVYESTGLSPLLLDILYSGASASMRGALGIPGDLQAWAAIFKSKVTSGNYFPIAGMWPDHSSRFWCAHETAGYTGCLAAHRAS